MIELTSVWAAMLGHRVQASMPCREQLDELSAELASFAQQHAGEEVLLLCVDHVTTTLLERLARGALRATQPQAAQATAAAASTTPTLMHAVVWCAPGPPPPSALLLTAGS